MKIQAELDVNSLSLKEMKGLLADLATKLVDRQAKLPEVPDHIKAIESNPKRVIAYREFCNCSLRDAYDRINGYV